MHLNKLDDAILKPILSRLAFLLNPSLFSVYVVTWVSRATDQNSCGIHKKKMMSQTKMGARQCSSETVRIVHTFFLICHLNPLCLQCVNLFYRPVSAEKQERQ